MEINEETLSDFIYKVWKNDYFRFAHMCSRPVVKNFSKNGLSVTVEYEFWDDGSSEDHTQENFIFDIAIGKDYGINFPARLQLVRLKDEFIWPSASQFKDLTLDFIEEHNLNTNVTYFEWGDAEIEHLVDSYFGGPPSNYDYVKALLIEAYRADQIGLPECIPKRLNYFFENIINLSN